MTFIQIIEFQTKRAADFEALSEEWIGATAGKRTARRATLSVDRDRADTYVQIVEFPSYEAAMANSALPETGHFAEQLSKLCDAPPVFRNIDVRSVYELEE